MVSVLFRKGRLFLGAQSCPLLENRSNTSANRPATRPEGARGLMLCAGLGARPVHCGSGTLDRASVYQPVRSLCPGGQSSVACAMPGCCHPQFREEPLGSTSPPEAWGQAAPSVQRLFPNCPRLQCVVEKRMATHSSFLAWRIRWTEEPGGPQSMGSRRVGHDAATNATTPHSVQRAPWCLRW